MAKKSYEEKILTLSLEFSKYLLEHEELDEQIPDNATILFLPKSDPEYCEYAKGEAQKKKSENHNVVFVEFDGLQPEVLFRMVNPHLVEFEPA